MLFVLGVVGGMMIMKPLRDGAWLAEVELEPEPDVGLALCFLVNHSVNNQSLPHTYAVCLCCHDGLKPGLKTNLPSLTLFLLCILP